MTETVTYRNDGDAAVELALAASVSDEAGADGSAAVSLSASSVSVPAGGTASVDVSVDPGAVGIGVFGGVVTATDGEGRVVRTPLGWDNEAEKHDLTIRAIGRDGAPADIEAAVLNVDDITVFGDFVPVLGETTLRVEAGSYSVTGHIPEVEWSEDGIPTFHSLSAVYEPQVEVTGDTVVVLDAREADPITVSTPEPHEVELIDLAHLRSDAAGTGTFIIGYTVGDLPVFATPTEPVVDGVFEHVTTYSLVGPGERPAYTYDLAFPDPVVPEGGLDYNVGPEDLAAIDTTYRAFEDPTELVEGRLALLPGWDFASASLVPLSAPTARTEWVRAGDVAWSQSVAGPEDLTIGWPVTWWDEGRMTSYAPGQEEVVEWYTAPFSHGLPYVGRFGDEVVVQTPMLADNEGHFSMTVDGGSTSLLQLWAGDELLGESQEFPQVVAVAPADAVLTVRQETGIDNPLWPLSTQVRSEWSFPSSTAPEEEGERLPMLDIRYDVLGLSPLNASGRRVTMELEVAQGFAAPEASAEVERLQVWWSADDGATWKRSWAWRIREGGEVVGYRVAFTVPAGTEFVSVRASAEASNGQSLTEEVIRAIRVE